MRDATLFNIKERTSDSNFSAGLSKVNFTFNVRHFILGGRGRLLRRAREFKPRPDRQKCIDRKK